MEKVIIGFIIGFFAGIVLIGISASKDHRIVKSQEAIETCERSLPRDQHCKVVITAEVVK